MPLGVGGATTFSMASNHQTALNHNFRPISAYDPNKQVRVKCTFCGCWATKGKDCPQCKRPAPPLITPRRNGYKVEPLVPFGTSSTASGSGSLANTMNGGPSPAQNGQQRSGSALRRVNSGSGGGGEFAAYGGGGGGDSARRPQRAASANNMRGGYAPTGPSHTTAHTAAAAAAFLAATTTSSAGGGQNNNNNRNNAAANTNHHNLLQDVPNVHEHRFRPVSSFEPSRQTKVKCKFCGCWAKKLTPCGLCKTINK